MQWAEVRQAYPEQWLVIEALEANTQDTRRHLDRMAVVEVCPDGLAALQSYRRWHQRYPTREFYFVHTGRVELEIIEHHWIGIRTSHAAPVKG